MERKTKMIIEKPPYSIPQVKDTRKAPKHSLKVISTFTGAGGSCYGFSMAGFTPIWASEFIPAARETYLANFPDVLVCSKDIRDIQPEEILKTCKIDIGEIDIVEGSPPCASFSLAGNLNASWGKVKRYSETEQRTDDLFYEYARIVKGLQPRVFIAENVSGLVRGVSKGYFKDILKELKNCGYNIVAKLLDAQWLGVPQQRQRIIFIGTRIDLDIRPVFPSPLPFRYVVKDALPEAINIIMSQKKRNASKVPSCVISAQPAWDAATTTQGLNYIENAVIYDDGYKRGLSNITNKPVRTIRQGCQGCIFVVRREGKFIDPETGQDLTIEDHFAISKEWDKLKKGETSDKYFLLGKIDPKKPARTIMQAQGVQGMAETNTHYLEKRKLSIAELRRLSSFPDDFILTGTYKQRWERIGRAVPPVMMFHIARKMRDQLLKLDGIEPWKFDPACLPVPEDYLNGES